MSDSSRLVESWTWYGVATFVVAWRFISRSMLCEGWKNLHVDDYLMGLVFAVYTNLIVWVNIQSQYPDTNILPPTGTAGLSPQDIQDRIYGSKVTFIVEQSMLLVQWGCKACMIILYFNLTKGLKIQRFVKFLIGYIALGWVIVEVFFYGVWCQPFLDYFAVNDDVPLQCQTAGHHLIMSYVFNLSSDLLMLLVPIPIFLRSQLPWKKKLLLLAIFSLGIFVIIAATLNRYYCFANPDSILWIFWYIREASTAMIVTNIPHCYPLLRRILKLREFGASRRPKNPRELPTQAPHAAPSLPKSSALGAQSTTRWKRRAWRTSPAEPPPTAWISGKPSSLRVEYSHAKGDLTSSDGQAVDSALAGGDGDGDGDDGGGGGGKEIEEAGVGVLREPVLQ